MTEGCTTRKIIGDLEVIEAISFPKSRAGGPPFQAGERITCTSGEYEFTQTIERVEDVGDEWRAHLGPADWSLASDKVTVEIQFGGGKVALLSETTAH